MKGIFVFTCLVALTATARPPAPDLGDLKGTLARYAAAEADAKAPAAKRARAKMERLVLELRTCEDAALKAKIAETRAFIEQGGGLTTAVDRVDFLLNAADAGGVFELPDVEKLAETAAKGDRTARERYVDLMLGRCRPQRDDFTYSRSHERRLAIVEDALKDPLLEKSRERFERRRFEILRDLGRRDEAVKYAEEKIAAAADAGVKRGWYGALAVAYREDARRYAEKPSPVFLKKSEEMLVKGASLSKDGLTPGECLDIAQMRADVGDGAGAREFVAKSRTGKVHPRTQSRGEQILGDVAYDEGNWSEAANRYLPLFDGKSNEHNQVVRFVQALFAADRRKEAIPLVKWLSEEKSARFRQTREDFKKLLKELESE